MAGLLALPACSPPPIRIDVGKAADGRMQAHLSQDWGFIIPRREAPCIREIALHSVETPYGNPIWQARRAGDDTQCTPLSTIILGAPPPGFAQTGPLPKTLRGPYLLTIRGIGFGDRVVSLAP